MVTKTYKCPIHGEFEYTHESVNEELKRCFKNVAVENGCHSCGQLLTRVFKPVGYSWKCDGFAGRGFDTAK